MADANAPFRIKGETGEWEVVVGLEVHAQITATKSKLFSGAATAFGAEPNTQVSLVDAAMPGMLPVPNKECIRQAVRTGMALDAEINSWSPFRPQELFLRRPAAGLSDQPALPSAGRRGRGRDPARREGREQRQDDRHRAHPRRAGRGQADARPASDDELRRPQPLGRRADGDRVAARHAFARRSRGLSAGSCGRSCATSARATAIWKKARCAPTSTSACASPAASLAPGPRPRTSTRCAS